MLFNSFIFLFVFLPITYIVFWTLRTAQQRYVWLALSGYVFYGYWDPRFCLLMAFSTLVSYCAGLSLLRVKDAGLRKLSLVIPITVDLLLLGFFKYAGFGLRSAETALGMVGIDLDLPVFDIVLPVGISFYTFHTITYIVDSYRGLIKPTQSIWEFSAYVSLFSQLVAGPIVRFRQIEQDLDNIEQADRRRWLGLGISFFVIGLVQKVLVADTLAGFVDPAFEDYASLSTVSIWLLMLTYSFQLYFDFCGYSAMAVGLGYMFGLRIPQNFNSPYKALDPSDFWRRWHISLSTAMRDYLYISFGGNKHGISTTYRNLMLTMLIGGLWHGANWTFIVWGFYHGCLLILYRHYRVLWDGLHRIPRQVSMFILVMIGWVFFRSETLDIASSLLYRMFVLTQGEQLNNLAILLPLLILAAFWSMVGRNPWEWNENREWRLGYGMVMSLAFGSCVAVIAGGRDSPFLYFQF